MKKILISPFAVVLAINLSIVLIGLGLHRISYEQERQQQKASKTKFYSQSYNYADKNTLRCIDSARASMKRDHLTSCTRWSDSAWQWMEVADTALNYYLREVSK